MKRIASVLVLALARSVAQAQDVPPNGSSDQIERARIENSRAQEETRFAQAEVACYARFAVNDCLTAARTQRREALADLRRQEKVLNDAERRRKGADQILRVEKRGAPAAPASSATSPKAPA